MLTKVERLAFLLILASACGNSTKPVEKPRPEAVTAGESGLLIELEPFVVSLNEPEGNRYLNVRMNLELNEGVSRGAIEKNIVRLRHQFLLYLSNLSFADIQKASYKSVIQHDLTELANKVLGFVAVDRVYLAEFVSQ